MPRKAASRPERVPGVGRHEARQVGAEAAGAEAQDHDQDDQGEPE